MAGIRARHTTQWTPFVVACIFGCATETQGDGLLPGPDGSAGSATAGQSSTDGGSSAGTMSKAGSANGGASSGGGGGSGGGVTFAGTFSIAGAGAGGDGGAAIGGGGAGGKGGSGGSSAGAGGKGGSGGSGGAAAGAGGKGGAGGSGGQASTTCGTDKLIPLAATDGGDAQYSPSNAIDGDATTRWGSVHMNDAAYLQLDMGEAVTVSRIAIVWQSSYAEDYKLQIANDAAGPFTDLYEDKAGNGGTDDITTPTLKLGRGRYIRMQGVTRHSQTYGYSIYEISVYGDLNETCL